MIKKSEPWCPGRWTVTRGGGGESDGTKVLFGTVASGSAMRKSGTRLDPRFSRFPSFQFICSLIVLSVAVERALDADRLAGFF